MQPTKVKAMLLLTMCLLSGFSVPATLGQSNPGQENQEQDRSAQALLDASSAPSSAAPNTRRSRSTSALAGSARRAYQARWGIDNIRVRQTASGILLRLSYRVADANKAKELNDKKATPYLIDQKTGFALQIPTMPKVGMLRQTGSPVNGLEYWMVFSNKGRLVKPGNRVDLVIGSVRLDGLVVE